MMTPAEVLWRAGRAGRNRVEPLRISTRPRLPRDDAWWDAALRRFRLAEDRPVLLDRGRAELVAARHPALVRELEAAAERALAGRFTYFGYPEVRLPRPVDWNLDPVSGFHWPLEPAPGIDHRTAAADPKWIWELNRLQHLPWFAQAWLFTGREEFADAALETLDSWLDQNPVGRGIAWRGAFEAGVRAISVLVALQGLRDAPGLTTGRFRRAVEMLEASGRMCWHERSLFSSANNHLVGEMSGLATIALLLPELPQAARWRARALGVLEREAGRQILSDGMGAEQAVAYQMFTVELILVVMTLLSAGGTEPPGALSAAVRRSSGFLASLAGHGDPVPHYGDDDDGFALRLGPEPQRSVADHLDIVAGLGAGPQGSARERTTLASAWIELATRGAGHLDLVPQGAPRSFLAPAGGLVVLREGRQRVTMDVGPLGYLSIAAHGHADALSVTYVLDGQELIGDPGAGSYYGHPDWRRAHRGTAAHATVTVDDEDQSQMAGPFMWSHHARVRLRACDLDRAVVDAEHDGYQRLAKPVTHRRWLRAVGEESGFVVVDLLLGRGEHEATVSWPLAPDLSAQATAWGHLVSREGAPVLQIASAATSALVHDEVVGDPVTNLGWWSDRLEQRRPAPLCTSTCAGEVPLAVVSVVRPLHGHAAELALPVTDLRVEQDEPEIQITWAESGLERSFVIRVDQNASVRNC